MKMLKVRFAGIPIEITSHSCMIERFCRDYLCDGEPLFSVSVTEEKINEELQKADEPTTFDYAEALCLYREIAEKLPLYDRIVFHGAAIEHGRKAYIFTAPSGTGKTTHIKLWKRCLGDKVKIINGDKPILSFSDGKITVHGTPYAGKEGWQTNMSAELGGICFLSQGKDNEITAVSPKDAFTRLYLQTYKPKTEEAVRKTFEIIRTLCTVPCFAFSCNMTEEAVKTSFEALTNEKYGETI